MAVDSIQASPKTSFLNTAQQKSSNLFKAVSEKGKADSFALSEGREEKDGMFKVGGIAALLLGSITYLASTHKMLKAPNAIKLGTKITAGAGVALALAGAVMPLINRFDAKKNAPKAPEQLAEPTPDAIPAAEAPQPEVAAAPQPEVIVPPSEPAAQELAAVPPSVTPEATTTPALAAFDKKVDNIAATV